MKLMTGAVVLLTVFALIETAPVKALGSIEYDARLCAAGIVVLAADLNLKLDPVTPEHHTLWLSDRMAGTLGTLAWLCRRYATLHELNVPEIQHSVARLKVSFGTHDWQGTRQQLALLALQMPLETTGFEPGEASESMIEEAGKIYTFYCVACHLTTSPESTPPVFTLSEMAKRQPEKVFIARMILGVHGTPEVALQNPLSKRDISGMFAYLRTCSDICR